MPNIEVTPSLVHRDADNVAQVSTGLQGIADALTGAEVGGNEDFALTGLIAQCAAQWSGDLSEFATSVQNLSTKLHDSATAVERTEETNEAMSRQVPRGDAGGTLL